MSRLLTVFVDDDSRVDPVVVRVFEGGCEVGEFSGSDCETAMSKAGALLDAASERTFDPVGPERRQKR